MKAYLKLLMVALAAGALGDVSWRGFMGAKATVVDPGHPAEWLTHGTGDSSSVYLRWNFELSSPVERAWASVEASGGYTLYLNGDAVLKNEYWRPTRPDLNGLSSRGQRLMKHPPAIALNYPREYQWGDQGVPRVSAVADLTRHLKLGDNCLALVVRGRSGDAMGKVYGEMTLLTGDERLIATGKEWEASEVPAGMALPDWLGGELAQTSQPASVVLDPPGGGALRIVESSAFFEPFGGEWLWTSLGQGGDNAVFIGAWDVPFSAETAWVRVVSDRPYELRINGTPHAGESTSLPCHASGEWVLGTRAPRDLITRADAMTPDEVRSPYELGREFPLESSRPKKALSLPFGMTGRMDAAVAHALSERISDRVGEHPASEGADLSTYSSMVGEPPQELGYSPASFLAHDVTGMLHQGVNKLELRVAGMNRREEASSATGVAADFWAKAKSGEVVSGGTDLDWGVQGPNGDDGVVSTTELGSVLGEEPPLQWLGDPSAPTDSAGEGSIGRVTSLLFILAMWPLALFWASRYRFGHDRKLTAGVLGARGAVLLLVPLGALLLSVSFAEMREGWHFARPWPWAFALGICIAAAPIAAALPRGPHVMLAFGRKKDWEPGGKRWWVLVASVAVLALILRAWDLGGQPLDDDEYASAQAIRAIAQTGVPALGSEAVIYTRGPLYHYLVAGFVKILGDSIWVMRLPSVLFGVATCLLVYRMGLRLIGSGWMALGAMALYAFHPFCVFTGHVARFYQQQQFFALLTVHLFILGFVRPGNTRLRVYCVTAWVAAVLSQEISALMGFQLAVGFFFFRRGRPWAEDRPVVLVGLIGAIMIALDYAAFQVLCLTRSEGISANVEARIGWNLTDPYNMTALFLGYSRIHVVGSMFLLPSLVHVLRRGARSWLGLHFVLISGVVLSNVLITHVSLRYQYWLIPVWLILAVHGVVISTRTLGRVLATSGALRSRVVATSRVISLLVLLVAWAPWRIPSSYGSTLLGDATGAMKHIASQLRDGDRVFVTEPHSHAALAETGRVDGYLSFPLLHDFHYRQDGVVVDRNGGSPVISSVAGLQSEFAEEGRIWVAVNREKWKNRAKNLRWEYPGARAELFLRSNCQLVHESYLWSVYLWDPGAGRLRAMDVAMK